MCIDVFLMYDMVVSISKKYWYKRTYMCLAEQDYTANFCHEVHKTL